MKKIFLLLIIPTVWMSVQAQSDTFWEHDYDSARYIVKQYFLDVFDRSSNPPKIVNRTEIDLHAILVFSGDYLNIYLEKSTRKYVVTDAIGYRESNFDSGEDEYEWLQYRILDERGKEGTLTVHNYIELTDTYFFLIFDNIRHSYITYLEKYHRNENKSPKENLPQELTRILAMEYRLDEEILMVYL